MDKKLTHYFDVLDNNELAKYLVTKDELEDRIKAAKEILQSCHFCERRCGVNRLKGERGFCGVGKPRVASEFIHWGEERELIPSYTVFFTGCTFSCQFCQNWDISQYPQHGVYIEPETLANMITKRVRQGVKNVNWVGGDPTPNIHYILEVLSHCNENIPQVWNSNMYLTQESLELLDGVIDLYLTDFKYGNDACAKRLSKVDDYWEIITRNHLLVSEEDIIIRHLVLPNHIECCSIPILKWIAENLRDKSVKVNVMDQYHPEWKASRYEDINRGLHGDEFERAHKFAEELGLSLC